MTIRPTDLVLTTNLAKEQAEGVHAFVTYDWRSAFIYVQDILPFVYGATDKFAVTDVRASLDKHGRPTLAFSRDENDYTRTVYLTIPSITVEQLSELRAAFLLALTRRT